MQGNPSVTYINFEAKGLITMSHYLKSRCSRSSSLRDAITGPLNIGHVDLNFIFDQNLGHTDSLCENMTFIHHTVFKIKGKNQYRSL